MVSGEGTDISRQKEWRPRMNKTSRMLRTHDLQGGENVKHLDEFENSETIESGFSGEILP